MNFVFWQRRYFRQVRYFLAFQSIWWVTGCYSLDYARMEFFSRFCWDCGAVRLSCEDAFRGPQDMDAEEFEFPVGSRSGQGFYIAQGFGEPNPRFGGKLHLGEDWNYVGGGDSDYGAAVYSIAKGVVTQVESFGGGWGLVLRICHRPAPRLQNEFSCAYLESLYAHLYSVQVEVGEPVGMGQWVASIGDGDGKYSAHLHFEIRSEPGRELGGGYAEKIPDYFVHPVKFLNHFQKRFAP